MTRPAMPDRETVVRVEARPRRGLRRPDAALYVGVSVRQFDEWVKEGQMPQPKRVGGVVVWDVRELDVAFDALGDDANADHTWDDWR